MKLLKVIIPFLVLASALAVGKYITATAPEAKKKPFVEKLPVVEVISLKREDYSVIIETSGVVKAGTQSSLISEVSGRVLTTSKKFQEGEYIARNETLLTIDKANYDIALSIVESEVAGNRAAIVQLDAEEKSNKRSYQLARSNLFLGKKEVTRLRQLFKKKLIARSILDNEEQKVNQLEQKLQDLQGKSDTYPSRKLAIQAKLNASLARKKKEKLNLSRTKIKAPYAGRILEKKVDVGQFVSAGTLLGKIVSTDYVDVVLPLSLNRYELLGISEAFKNKKVREKYNPEVLFSAIHAHSSNETSVQWTGRIVRTSVALNTNSRQITVIARIEDPFDSNGVTRTPIRIGQYLEAKIKGKTFTDVYKLPPIAVRQNKEILLLENGKVEVVPISIIWNSPSVTIIKAMKNIVGKQLIITPMTQAITGMKVLTVDQQRNVLKKDKGNEKVPSKTKVPQK